MLTTHDQKISPKEKTHFTINFIEFTGSRRLMVINGYGLYKSTGINSKMNGVLFPFQEIEPNGHIKKLSETQESKKTSVPRSQWLLGFPTEQSKKFRSLSKKSNLQLQRFGNIETMLISLAFSEAAWKKNAELKELSDYLMSQKVYKNYIEKLRETKLHFKEAKDYSTRFLKTFPKLEEYARDRQKKDAADINQWLSEQGKIYKIAPIYASSMQERLENPTLQIKSIEYNQNRFFNSENLVRSILEIFKQIAIACISSFTPFSFFDHSSHLKDEKNHSLKRK